MADAQPLPEPESQSAEESVWRGILDAGSPREVLAKLVASDPLRLGPRCQERTISQALLLDSRRLYLRASAHVARHASKYQGAPGIDIWLAEHIRRALKELIAEDLEASRARDLGDEPEDPWIRGVAELLGVEPALVTRGCASFNQASYDVRSAFFGILVDSKPIAVWAKTNGVSEERARTSLKKGLWLLGLRDELDLDEFLEGRTDEP